MSSNTYTSLYKWFSKSAYNFLLRHNRIFVYTHGETVIGYKLDQELKKLINTPNPVCIDVGANEGQTIDMLLSIFRQPFIYSFEPATSVFEKLIEKDYPEHIKLYNYALGASNESRQFYNYQSTVLSSFLALDKHNDSPFVQNKYSLLQSTEIVKIRTLDNFVEKNKIKTINLLKIDTQGFDLEVIKGTELTLQNQKIDFILVELNFNSLYSDQANATDIINTLMSYGYYLADFYEVVRRRHRIDWCTALFVR